MYGHDGLSDERIDRLVRRLHAERKLHRDGRSSRLAMLAMCFVCLVVGASARDLTHWAIGDYEGYPFGRVAVWPRDHFRCGIGGRSAGAADTARRPFGPSATDTPPALPSPSGFDGP